MERCVYAIEGEECRWFDPDKAAKWTPKQERYGGEILYLTTTGKWILNTWSKGGGDRERYEEIPATGAAVWMVKNGKWTAQLKDEIAALES